MTSAKSDKRKRVCNIGSLSIEYDENNVDANNTVIESLVEALRGVEKSDVCQNWKKKYETAMELYQQAQAPNCNDDCEAAKTCLLQVQKRYIECLKAEFDGYSQDDQTDGSGSKPSASKATSKPKKKKPKKSEALIKKEKDYGITLEQLKEKYKGVPYKTYTTLFSKYKKEVLDPQKKKDAAVERERKKQEARKEKESKNKAAAVEKEQERKAKVREKMERTNMQKEEKQQKARERKAIAQEKARENLREAERKKKEEEQQQREIEAKRKAEADAYIKRGVVINTTLGLVDGCDQVEYFTDRRNKNEIAVCGNKTLHLTKDGSTAILIENERRSYNKPLQSIYGFNIENDRIEKTKEEDVMNMEEPEDKTDTNKLDKEQENMNTLWNNNKDNKKDDKSFKGFFEPADHQLAVLKATLDKGVLICHGPGQGKTINAILLAERKRVEKGKGNRILVVAPQGQILQQWQQTVVEMGINPSHYIFQTLAHFRLSQLERQYPEYINLTQKVKDFYEKEAWKLDNKTNKYVLTLPSKEEEGEYIVDENKEIQGVRHNFVPPLENDPSLSRFRELLKTSVKSSTEDKYYRDLTSRNVEAWYTIDGINTFDANDLKRIPVKDRDKYKYRDFLESIYDTLRAIEPYTFICMKDEKYILFSSVDIDMDPVDMSVDQKRNLLKAFDNNEIKREQTTVKEFNTFLEREEGRKDIKQFQLNSLPEAGGRRPKMDVYILNGELRITSVNTLRKEFDDLKSNDATTTEKLKEFLNNEFGLKAFVNKRFPRMKPKYNEQKNVKIMKTSIEEVLKTLEKKYKFTKDDPATMVSKTVADVKGWIQNDRCILVKGEYFIKENGTLTMDDLTTIENIAWIERYNYPTIDISDIKNCNYLETSLKLSVDKVDTFTNLQHGKSLLQHRYIAEPSCILILDEAHACLSIDDKKKNTSTLMDYGKTSTFNILVTATPFLSSNPLKQMLQFAQILNQNSEIEMKDMWGTLKSKISRYNKLSKDDGDVMFQQLKEVGYFKNANVPYLPYQGVDTPNEMYGSSTDMYNDHKQILLATINTLGIQGVKTQANYFVEEQERSSETFDDEKFRNAYLEHLKGEIKIFSVRNQKMKMYLHDNDVKWDIAGTKRDVFDENSKNRLVDKAMRSIFPERESTVAINPFPTKLKAVDIDVKYPIEACNVSSNTYHKIWDLGLTDIGECTVFEYIETLDDTWKKKYTYLNIFSDTLKQYGKWKNKWIPIVVHINEDNNDNDETLIRKQQEVLTVLNTIAYVKKELFVILLWETEENRACTEEDIKTLLPQIRAYRCRRYNSAKALEWQRRMVDESGWECDINCKFLDDELQKKFNKETTPNACWKQTLQSDDKNLKEATVPYFHLESKVYEIAYFIEQCVAENKNVIVYDFSIEKLQELERELLRRQNKKVILDEKKCNFTNEDIQTIGKYIKKKWKLWINEVEGYNKQDELKFMENTLKEVGEYLDDKNTHDLTTHGKELLRALKEEVNDTEELLRFKYNHIAKVSRKGYYAKPQIEETFKLKESVYSTDQNGYYTLEDGTKILATMDHIPITKIVYNYVRAKKKKDLLNKKDNKFTKWKTGYATKIEGLNSFLSILYIYYDASKEVSFKEEFKQNERILIKQLENWTVRKNIRIADSLKDLDLQEAKTVVDQIRKVNEDKKLRNLGIHIVEQKIQEMETKWQESYLNKFKTYCNGLQKQSNNDEFIKDYEKMNEVVKVTNKRLKIQVRERKKRKKNQGGKQSSKRDSNAGSSGSTDTDKDGNLKGFIDNDTDRSGSGNDEWSEGASDSEEVVEVYTQGEGGGIDKKNIVTGSRKRTQRTNDNTGEGHSSSEGDDDGGNSSGSEFEEEAEDYPDDESKEEYEGYGGATLETTMTGITYARTINTRGSSKNAAVELTPQELNLQEKEEAKYQEIVKEYDDNVAKLEEEKGNIRKKYIDNVCNLKKENKNSENGGEILSKLKEITEKEKAVREANLKPLETWNNNTDDDTEKVTDLYNHLYKVKHETDDRTSVYANINKQTMVERRTGLHVFTENNTWKKYYVDNGDYDTFNIRPWMTVNIENGKDSKGVEYPYEKPHLFEYTLKQTLDRLNIMNKRNRIRFSVLTGKHTPKISTRNIYKNTFEMGMIDCLLLNDAMITGIDFKSTRESVCISMSPIRQPGREEQFVGRMVRRESHVTCPQKYQKVQHFRFLYKEKQTMQQQEKVTAFYEKSSTEITLYNETPDLDIEALAIDSNKPEISISSVVCYYNHGFLSLYDYLEHPLCYYKFGVSKSRTTRRGKIGGYKAAGFEFNKESKEWETVDNSIPYQWSCYVCHWQNAENYTVCSNCCMKNPKNYIHMELSYLPISDEDFGSSIDKDVKEAYTEQVKEMAGYNMDFALHSIEHYSTQEENIKLVDDGVKKNIVTYIRHNENYDDSFNSTQHWKDIVFNGRKERDMQDDENHSGREWVNGNFIGDDERKEEYDSDISIQEEYYS